MQLLDELRDTAERLESVFQAQLMREDCDRIEKLGAMAKAVDSYEEFEKAGLYMGWTQGDMRTHELTGELKPFLEAVYSAVNGDATDSAEATVRQTWISFNKARMRKLIGCL